MELINRYFSIIALGLLTIIMLQGLLNDNSNPENELYRAKINELNQDIVELNKSIYIIDRDNERLKKDINKDSTVIYDSSREYRDSIRAALFN